MVSSRSQKKYVIDILKRFKIELWNLVVQKLIGQVSKVS